MSRNASGTYTLPTGNPVVSGTLIEASWANTTLSDIATAMTDSLSRSGQGGMTAALRLYDGTSSVPGLAWGSETTTGWYRAGAGDMRLVITGSQVIQYLSTGVAITGTLSASGNFAVNTNKFTVAASSGNTAVAGTLDVTGNATVGGTLAITGALTLTANPILSAGTANGVAYLNGSKVLTTGSALTFDGTNFSTTGNMSVAIGKSYNCYTTDYGFGTPDSNGLQIFYAAGDALRFGSRSSGTFSEQMRLTSTGLGIGTSSPGAKLHVAGEQLIQPTTAANAKLSMRHGSIGNNNYFEVDNSSNTIFGTNNAERARIDSSGNLLVGTTSGSFHRFHKSSAGDFAVQSANTSATTPYVHVLTFTAAAPNDATSMFLRCDDTGATGRIQLRSNGGIANYSANDVNLSDRREKTNFAPAGEYLSKICAIPVQTFNYIDQSEDDPGLTLGVVAQDVQAVAPELVMESNWGTEDEPKMRLSIYQTDLQYALMKCIQEQQALIQSLTARVAQLEGK